MVGQGVLPPFRWDVSKRHELGHLLDGWEPDVSRRFVAELLLCSARILELAGNGDLYFVGRSADDVFELLRGLLAHTSWAGRPRLLPVSLRWDDAATERSENRAILRGYLAGLGLSPLHIASRSRPTTLVDVVDTGKTFGTLVTTFHDWHAQGVAWEQIRAKVRIVGIVERVDAGPKTWRWQQHVAWAHLVPPRAVRSVSVPAWFWSSLVGSSKASRSFAPAVWGDPTVYLPGRDASTLQGLRRAAYLYETGLSPRTRRRFAFLLTSTPAMRSAWMRSLARELRASAGRAAGCRVNAWTMSESSGEEV